MARAIPRTADDTIEPVSHKNPPSQKQSDNKCISKIAPPGKNQRDLPTYTIETWCAREIKSGICS